jgi:hypothetical protein
VAEAQGPARQTKPICQVGSGSHGRARPGKEVPAGPILSNKPNFHPMPIRRSAFPGTQRAKQSQFRGGTGRGEAPGAWDAGRLRKTNPIWPGLGKAPMRERCETNPIPGYAGWDGAWERWDYGKIVQNEPNLPAGPRDTPSPLDPPASALRRGGLCETKPICLGWTRKTIAKAKGLDDATRHGGQARQTKPIRPQTGMAGGPVVQNKANFRRRPVGGDRVVSPSTLAPVASGLPLAAVVRNKANSPQSRRTHKYLLGKGLRCICPAVACRQNKTNFRSGAGTSPGIAGTGMQG